MKAFTAHKKPTAGRCIIPSSKPDVNLRFTHSWRCCFRIHHTEGRFPTRIGNRYQSRSRNKLVNKSKFNFAMTRISIPFGQAEAHSVALLQGPKASSSICNVIALTRSYRSGWPCGKLARWLTLAPVNSIADAFGQLATHAPQPIQAAASNARSAFVLLTGVA